MYQKTYTVEQIKKIFLKERKEMLNSILASPEGRWNEDTLRYSFELLFKKIEQVKTDNDLSVLIGECCRMSIQEWVNSL